MGVELDFSFHAENMDRLKVFENTMLRRILGLRWRKSELDE
jgi:hypothetical protein